MAEERARLGWSEIVRRLECALGGAGTDVLKDGEARAAAAAVRAGGCAPLLAGWFLEVARRQAIEIDRPAFWQPLLAFPDKAVQLEKSQLAAWVGSTLRTSFGQLRASLDGRSAVAAALDILLSDDVHDKMNTTGTTNALPEQCSTCRARVLQLVVDRAQPSVLPAMLTVFLQDTFNDVNSADAALFRSEDDEDEECPQEMDDPVGARAAALESVAGMGADLRGLDSLSLALEAGTEVLFQQITAHTARVACDIYEPGLLDDLTQWLGRVVLPWLAALLSGDPDGGQLDAEEQASASDDAAAYAQWRRRLEFHLYETIANLRTGQLFDIIVEYPDSLPALEHLRTCLERTRLHPGRLLATLSHSLQSRLLQPGAMTADILAQFISTVKALRHLEPELPAAASVPTIGAPIKAYLRGRTDTIRQIVTALTDDSELLEDSLAAVAAKPAAQDDSSDEEGSAKPPKLADDHPVNASASSKKLWMPNPAPTLLRPAHALGRGGVTGGGDTDIISMLINIFGSKELFVTEYRSMLGHKLVASSDFDLNKEKRNLELLKLRFAEGGAGGGGAPSGRVTSLHSCEVMLKDITDSVRLSKRIQANIRATVSRSPTASDVDSPFDCPIAALQPIIISHVFWPKLPAAPTEMFRLPPGMAGPLAQYESEYSTLKAPRKLTWVQSGVGGAPRRPTGDPSGVKMAHNVGQVTLQLDFDSGMSQEYHVAPIDAALIAAFAGLPAQGTLSAAELGELLNVDCAVVQRRVTTWLDKYVLELVSSATSDGGDASDTAQYRVVHDPKAAEAAALSDGPAPRVGGDEEGFDGDGAGSAAAAAQLEQEMAVFESYIIGMLTNLKQLPVSKIHNMLKIFVTDPPYDKEEGDLVRFLSRMVAEEKLECQSGMYSLK
eukprot:SAG31_NODE_833_length_11657_cov_3.652535_5_plen_895_part_00